jgi:CRP-like cAMP-binding protein
LEIHAIKKSLDKLCHLPDEQVELFCSMVTEKTISKNSLVLKQGYICNFVAIVLKGSLRLHNPENERTVSFFTESDWVADHESFVVQRPSINVIEAMEDAEIAIINIHNLHKLIAINPSFIVLMRVLGDLTASTLSSVYHTSPMERYNILMKKHPDWIIRFPQKYLASYLGMTPETFSRMKRKTLFS